MANQYEAVLESIRSLGRQAVCAQYRFTSVAAAQDAAGQVVDSLPDLVTLARAGKAKIGSVRLNDAVVLIVGGLLTPDLLSSAHQIVLRSGGTFHAAAVPDGFGLIIGPAGVEALGTLPRPSGSVSSTARPWWKFW